MKYLMNCGHVNNSTCKGKPFCVICGCGTIVREVKEKDGLEGRTAHCRWCSAKTDSRWELPFFEHHSNLTHDNYYCGCRGWD